MDANAALAPRRHKVTERIVAEIQRRIGRAELKAGDRLPSERNLADLFGASRASVREALRSLERSGLVVARHGEGNFVARMPEGLSAPLAHYLDRERHRLLDLSEARQVLEPRLAALAATRATAADLTRMKNALADEIRAIRGDDVEGGFTADRAFHVAIAEATHSPTFAMLHNFLSDLVGDSRREAIYHDSRRSPSRHADHAAILAAIERGDADEAAAAMLRHVQDVEVILVNAVLAYQGLVVAGTGRGPIADPGGHPGAPNAGQPGRRSGRRPAVTLDRRAGGRLESGPTGQTTATSRAARHAPPQQEPS
jgi:GntR family transcriptional repressor for pyruvate dehydrogenase complex